MSVVAMAALNRDAAASGTIRAEHGQTVQLLGADVTGWGSVAWRITSYPPEFALPVGWALDGSDYVSNAIRPPAFQLPPQTSGKWEIDLTVDGVTDASLRLVVVTTNVGLTETNTFENQTRSGFRGFARDVNRNWRLLDDAVGRALARQDAGAGSVMVQAVATTPGWNVVGAFTASRARAVKLRLLGCVSTTELLMRGRLFDLSASPPAPLGTVSLPQTLATSVADSAPVQLISGHLYQLQVEVTGGSGTTLFGAVEAFQAIDP